MTNLRTSFIWLIALVVLLASACNDPTDLGSELLEEEFSDIRFTDTVTVNALTVPQDSIFTYTRIVDSQPNTYLCGFLDDPIFGTSQATINFDLGLVTNSGVADIDFSDVTFDSLVLSLAYNPFRTYGDTLVSQNINVYRLSEEMDYNEEFYYSDRDFEAFPTPIGQKLNFLPQPNTTIIRTSAEDTVVQAAHIRIPLSPALAAELMPIDTMVAEALYENNETFRAFFNGLKIESDAVNSNILGFNLRSSLTYMAIYYRDADDNERTFTFRVVDLGTKHNNFKHDFSGSISEPFVENQSLSDSLLFVQGMSGYNVKIDFPYIQNLDGIVVNKAELDLTFADIPGDDTITYEPPARIILTELDDNGNYIFIEDVSDALALANIDLYGGEPFLIDDNGTTLRKYKLNISNHIQDIIDDRLGGNNSVYMQVYLKNQYAYRGMFYGTGHSKYPLKLNLAYTKL